MADNSRLRGIIDELVKWAAALGVDPQHRKLFQDAADLLATHPDAGPEVIADASANPAPDAAEEPQLEPPPQAAAPKTSPGKLKP